MASYALQTPPWAAHAKPPGPMFVISYPPPCASTSSTCWSRSTLRMSSSRCWLKVIHGLRQTPWNVQEWAQKHKLGSHIWEEKKSTKGYINWIQIQKRLNGGDNNGQATQGARMAHAWRTQAAWAKKKKKKKRLNGGDNNGQAMYGARKPPVPKICALICHIPAKSWVKICTDLQVFLVLVKTDSFWDV